jgi:hypothetical protein
MKEKYAEKTPGELMEKAKENVEEAVVNLRAAIPQCERSWKSELSKFVTVLQLLLSALREM